MTVKVDRRGIDAVLVPDSVGAALCTGPLWGHHGYQRSISLRVDHLSFTFGTSYAWFQVVMNDMFWFHCIDAVLVSDSVGAALCTGPLWRHYSHQRSAKGRTATREDGMSFQHPSSESCSPCQPQHRGLHRDQGWGECFDFITPASWLPGVLLLLN